MGFDFGMKRIGIAVGQKVTQTASGLGVVQAFDGIPKWDYLDKIVLDWQPERFIVGLPINMDGSNSEMSKKAQQYRVKRFLQKMTIFLPWEKLKRGIYLPPLRRLIKTAPKLPST